MQCLSCYDFWHTYLHTPPLAWHPSRGDGWRITLYITTHIRLSSAFDDAGDGGALRGGDTEEVGAGGEVGEVDAAGCLGPADTAAGVVVDVDTDDVVSLDGDNARGGVGIDSESGERVGSVDADLVDDEHQDDDAVTARVGGADIEVLATLGVGGAVPGIAVGSGVVEGVADTVVEGEVEGDDGVAALRVES